MTVISHEHKFIFICPRKVAGTSIQASLSRHAGADDVMGIDFPARAFDRRADDDDFGIVRARVGDGTGRYEKHDLPDAVREKVGEKVWNEYFKFTVVRNPWDLLVSYLYFKFGPLYWRDVWWRGRRPFEFLLNLPRAFRLHRLRSEFRRGRRKESVEAILRERLFGPVEQIPQFYFSRGELYADRVIRFENLQQDYDEVCKRLGFPPRFLPRINTRQRPGSTDYRDYYTEYSREHVADLCRALTSEFGYRFDDGAPTHRGGRR